MEDRFAGSNCVVDDSYYTRLPLAKRWLDETEDDFCSQRPGGRLTMHSLPICVQIRDR